jgi:hypothetical protein
VTETTGQDSIWYLARDGKQHGPLSDLEMMKLVELGHLRATDLVWRPGFSDWRPAPTVFPAITAAAPKPVPAAPAPVAKPAPQPTLTPAVAEPAIAKPVADSAPAQADPATPSFAKMTSASSAATEARGSEAQPFDTRAFRPANAASQFGTPIAGAQDPEPQPFRMEPLFEDTEPKPRKRSGLGVALGMLVLVGGLTTAGVLYRDTIKATIDNLATKAPADVPVVEAPPESGGPATAESAIAAAEPAPAAPPPDLAPVTSQAPPATADAGAFDSNLQKSQFWSLAKTEFPQWYADRLRELTEMSAANQPEAVINQKLVEQVVALRRQHAADALAASPTRLQGIAETFVASLGAMQRQSIDACYDYIGKGELTPAAAAMVQNPVEGAPLHAQLHAVFAAVVEGKANPVQRAAPQTADYNLLAAELGAIGWSQADIQLFADPKALSEAPRDRVCKMVGDWFSAHLAVKDNGARERLLYETLRLVIAG